MQAPHLWFFSVDKVTNLRITNSEALPAPIELCESIPRTPEQNSFVRQSREDLHRLIKGEDRRLLAVVGPCSIHDLASCREYADHFAKLAGELKDRLLLVMRVYFEKPRTTVGWKGLIMDPKLNGTCDIPEGLRIARQFLGEVLDMGIPTATELLDPITPQYIADSLCWSAIGARTSESQTHRQMASGLSMPVGFKNATAGDLKGRGEWNYCGHEEPDLFGDYGRWTSLRGDYRGKPGLPTHPPWGNEWPQLPSRTCTGCRGRSAFCKCTGFNHGGL